jgi:hypothetical protein
LLDEAGGNLDPDRVWAAIMGKFRRNDTPQVSAGNNEKLIAPY